MKKSRVVDGGGEREREREEKRQDQTAAPGTRRRTGAEASPLLIQSEASVLDRAPAAPLF
jgi:hypothetical protein